MRELHLFAGIGGGIYGGMILGNQCVGAVEIDGFCQSVLRQRQADGWMETFPIEGDLCKLNGFAYQGKFDILCGGFPCQAFSTAAHGKNIAEKNLWDEMFRFVKQSQAPLVFGENVTEKAIRHAQRDLESEDYTVVVCTLSNGTLGADHQRNRFWLLGVRKGNKGKQAFQSLHQQIGSLPKITGGVWAHEPPKSEVSDKVPDRRQRLKAVGNAQSPLVAATAFRILVNRLHETLNVDHVKAGTLRKAKPIHVSDSELAAVYAQCQTWIQKTHGHEIEGYIHTPTTMANYSAPSMMKHRGCQNFVHVFKRPDPHNAEWLMGFPMDASSSSPQVDSKLKKWKCRLV